MIIRKGVHRADFKKHRLSNFELEICFVFSSSMPALRKVTPAPPCSNPLSVLCVLQIAFALHLWTNQVSTARPIRAGFSLASCISDIFANISPVPTSLQSAMVDDDSGYTWLDLWRAGWAFREVNKKNLILICRLGSFDLEVTGGKRNMGPRDVSSSPSLAVITPEKQFSLSATSSPPLSIDSMCQWWREKKATNALRLSGWLFLTLYRGGRVKTAP